MPARVSDLFELFVAVMLVGLGIRAIVVAVRQGPIGPARTHHHGHLVHNHAGATPHVHVGRWTLARRPLLVGAVHGLAGSGALTALVLATLSSTTARITYMALFGLGSTLGMAALSGLLGWPLAQMGANRTLVARDVARRRLRVDRAGPLLGLPAHFTVTVQLTGAVTGLKQTVSSHA